MVLVTVIMEGPPVYILLLTRCRLLMCVVGKQTGVVEAVTVTLITGTC